MFTWLEDLKIDSLDLFLDARKSRRCSFVSHAHSDHIAPHERILATAETSRFLAHRLGALSVRHITYRDTVEFGQRAIFTPYSAGHILGSAMLHVRIGDETCLYTGDFRLGPSLTVPSAEPCQADTLLMECTYGKPIFRFPPRVQVIAQLLELVEQAFREGRQPIVMGYSLGKAQEIMRILTDGGFNVTVHGAVATNASIYEACGVPLGTWSRYRLQDFHGKSAQDLRERGVLLAPPQAARSAFVTRFNNPLRIMLSGWGMLPNAKFRYGVDHVLPISDHADYDELLRMVDLVQPKQVLTHHGFTEFAGDLRRRGIDARPIRPPAQMNLFD